MHGMPVLVEVFMRQIVGVVLLHFLQSFTHQWIGTTEQWVGCQQFLGAILHRLWRQFAILQQ